jgi:threonine dehydratase
VIAIATIREADQRIRPHVVWTPLIEDAERGLWLKCENRQTTGSFKLRGALNKIKAQSVEAREHGVVAASAGNHGQGVAFAGRLVEAAVRVFTYEHAVPEKIAAMRDLGAEVVAVPGGYGEAEAAAIADARVSGRLWVSPYNDELVMAGQATLAVEIATELGAHEHVTVWVPAGGGGLAAGVGSALRALHPHWQVVAAQSEASAYLHAHYHGRDMGQIVESPSLADGLAGPVEPGSRTLGLVQEVVDDFVLVDEPSVAAAIAEAWWMYGERIEGSAAVALAAAREYGAGHPEDQVVILTGGNISPELHLRICAEGGQAGSLRRT